MHKTKLLTVIVAVASLLASVSAQTQAPVLGVWKDTNPTAYISPPANPPLNSVYMLSASEGWTVGDYSVSSDAVHAFPAVLHYDRPTWNLVPVPKNPTDSDIAAGYALTSVSFGPPNQPISRNDGWAVGFGFDSAAPCGTPLTCGLPFHWDGVTWHKHSEGLSGPNAGPLKSVFMVSSSDVWAVGEDQAAANGVFWHWSGVAGLGGGWSMQGTASGTPLDSVFMVSATEGWAMGSGGAIYHYTGGTWTAFTSPLPASVTLYSVFMISSTEGWAVGSGGNIIHYTAGSWTGPVSPGTTSNSLRSVFMISFTEGWAVGDAGTIIHYSGGSWTALPINQIPTLPATSFDFKSAYFNAARDGWVVGTNGVILHFDGSIWGTVTSPSLTQLNSISFGPPLSSGTNPDDGWAVGNATSSLLSRPAVTEPTIIHWNGFMWTKGVVIGATNDLFSVFMISSADVWAVGGGANPTATCTAAPCSTILHYTGGAWNTVTPPPGSYLLKSVFMISSSEGWAVGEQAGNVGIILHYTVSGGVGSWSIVPVPTSNGYGIPLPSLNSVFMLGPSEGWAVGDNASVLHFTVTAGLGTWNPIVVSGSPSLFTDTNLTSIFMLSPTSGWIVGGIPAGSQPVAGPAIIYWEGTHWTTVATPTIPGGPLSSPPILKSIYCTGASDCWVVGNADTAQTIATIFHWDGVAWTHITLAPSLLGLPVIPPNLNSVFMTSPTNGWIVGSPFFPPILPPQVLSTILWFVPLTGAALSTSTSVIVSTVSSSTTYVVTSTSSTSTNTMTTTTTLSITTTPSARIPGFPLESLILGISVGLLALLQIRRRKLRSKGTQTDPATLQE